MAAAGVATTGLKLGDSGPPTGGATSTGGATAEGGKGGTAGSPAGGGTLSTGGVSSAGGKSSAGGAPPTGGTAGLGGVAGTAGVAGTTHCPGTGGPTMVALPLGYCIDSTEVTRAQYKTWLDTNPPTTGQISECSWNTSFTPSSDWPPTDKLDYPVSYVDWCDAYAYCLAVGKRLCGKIGGGSNAYTDFNNASKSQWFSACSASGATRYPYGDTYNGTICNTTEIQNRASVAVGSMSSCQTPTHVYDMSGNVAEWEDSCEGSAKEQYCHLRGGSYCQNSNWKCNACGVTRYGNNRNNSNARYGFRCCS